MPLGKYWRNKPLVFSLVPRCHGLCGSAGQTITAGLVSVGLLVFGIGAFVVVQRQGMFGWILKMLRRLGLRIHYLESREQQLLDLDRTIAGFYATQRSAFSFRPGCFSWGGSRKRWKSSS